MVADLYHFTNFFVFFFGGGVFFCFFVGEKTTKRYFSDITKDDKLTISYFSPLKNEKDDKLLK